MKVLIALACLLAVAAAQVAYTAHTAVAPAYYGAAVTPYAHSAYLYRARRQIYTPAVYGAHGVAAVHTPYQTPYAYTPYVAAHYRKKRDLVAYTAPVAATYSATYSAHTPVATSYAAYPYAAHPAYLYRKRRDLYTTPVVYGGAAYHHAGYSAYPYAHYY